MFRFFILSMLLFLFACSDDSGTGPGNNGIPDLGNFSVDIDGTKWNATFGFVSASVSSNGTNSTLVVTASKTISTSQAQAMSIVVSAPAGNPSDLEGSYNFDATNLAAMSFVTTNNQNTVTYISIDGQLSISNVTANNVTGAFNAICVNSLTLQDTIALTNGAFNAAIYSLP